MSVSPCPPTPITRAEALSQLEHHCRTIIDGDSRLRYLRLESIPALVELAPEERELWAAAARLCWHTDTLLLRESKEVRHVVLGVDGSVDAEALIELLDEILPVIDAFPTVQTSIISFMFVLSSGSQRRVRFDALINQCSAVIMELEALDAQSFNMRAIEHVVTACLEFNQRDVLWNYVDTWLTEFETHDDPRLLNFLGRTLTYVQSRHVHRSDQATRVYRRCVALMEARMHTMMPIHGCPDPRDGIYEVMIKLCECTQTFPRAERLWRARIEDMQRSIRINLDQNMIQQAYAFHGRLLAMHTHFIRCRYINTGEWRQEHRDMQARQVELATQFTQMCGRIEISDSIPTAVIEAFTESVLDECGVENQLIALVGCIPFWTRQDILDKGEEVRSQSALRSLIPVRVITPDSRRCRPLSGEDEVLREGLRSFTWELLFKVATFFTYTLQALIAQDGFDEESITNVFWDAELLDDANQEVFKAGIRHLLARDHIAALYILTPQVEHCIRQFYQRATRYGIRESRGHEYIATLGEMLHGNDSLGGESRPEGWRDIAFLLYNILANEGIGRNLRNNICHGIWRNVDNASIDAHITFAVLLLLLCLDPIGECPTVEPLPSLNLCSMSPLMEHDNSCSSGWYHPCESHHTLHTDQNLCDGICNPCEDEE